MARRRDRVDGARQQQHRRCARRDAVERLGHRAARPVGAHALVQPRVVGAEVGAGWIGGLREPRRVFRAHHREVHAAGQRGALAHGEQAVQPGQRLVAAVRRLVDRLRQRACGGRQVQRAAHRAQHDVAGERERLGLSGQRMRDHHRLRQAREQGSPVRAQLGMCLPARGLGVAGGHQRIEGGLPVGGEAGRQHHVGRRDAVDHAAPHVLRELALVFERGARAVRAAHQVDAFGAQRAAHGIEVLHGDRGGEETQVAVRQALQRLAAARELRHLELRVGLVSQRLMALIGAFERRRSAGAALVHEHDVAPVVEPGEQRHHLRRDADRALARAAGEHEHRVGQLAARHRRHDRVAHVDRLAARHRRVERARHAAAQHLVADAGDAARRERLVGARGQRACPRADGQRRDRDAPPHGSPSRRFSSPLWMSFSTSSQPPTRTPRTNTIGNEGQPVHIFSALRRRHSLR